MFITTALRVMLISLCILGVGATPASAVSTNSVSVSSNSGARVITHNGSTTYSSSSASVSITSVINGETVVDIHKESSGEPIHIERVDTFDGDTTTTVIHTDTRATSDSSSVLLYVDSTDEEQHTTQATSSDQATTSAVLALHASTTPLRPYAAALTNLTRMYDAFAYATDESTVHDDSPVVRTVRSLMLTLRHVFTAFIF